MKILDPAELSFEPAANGFLRLKLNDGTIYEMVECHPLFPLSEPDAYISITKQDDSDVEEIGIIKTLKKLSAKQRSLVEREIQFRHFSPAIIVINKITSKYGVDQWEVVTDKGDEVADAYVISMGFDSPTFSNPLGVRL